MYKKYLVFCLMIISIQINIFASWWGIYTPIYQILEKDFEIDYDLFLPIQRNVIPDENYSNNNPYSYKYHYEYDEQNRVISIWSNEVGKKDYSIIRYTYTSDKIIRITRDFYSSFEDSEPKTTYILEITYGNKSIKEHKMKNGDFEEDFIYTLDDNNRTVRAINTSISAFSGKLKTNFDRTYSYPSDHHYCNLLTRLGGLSYRGIESNYIIDEGSLKYFREDNSLYTEIEFTDDMVVKIYKENDSPGAENKYQINNYEYNSQNNIVYSKMKHTDSLQGGGSLWDKEIYLYYESDSSSQIPIFYSGNAVVTDQRVRIRTKPNLESETIGYVNTEEIVIILDQTNYQMEIDNMNSVWYMIQTEHGLRGWVYGYFIEFEKNEI